MEGVSRNEYAARKSSEIPLEMYGPLMSKGVVDREIGADIRELRLCL